MWLQFWKTTIKKVHSHSVLLSEKIKPLHLWQRHTCTQNSRMMSKARTMTTPRYDLPVPGGPHRAVNICKHIRDGLDINSPTGSALDFLIAFASGRMPASGWIMLHRHLKLLQCSEKCIMLHSHQVRSLGQVHGVPQAINETAQLPRIQCHGLWQLAAFEAGVVTVVNRSVDLNTFQPSKEADSRILKKHSEAPWAVSESCQHTHLPELRVCGFPQWAANCFPRWDHPPWTRLWQWSGNGNWWNCSFEHLRKSSKVGQLQLGSQRLQPWPREPLDVSTLSNWKRIWRRIWKRPQLSSSDRGPNMSSSSARVFLKSGWCHEQRFRRAPFCHHTGLVEKAAKMRQKHRNRCKMIEF